MQFSRVGIVGVLAQPLGDDKSPLRVREQCPVGTSTGLSGAKPDHKDVDGAGTSGVPWMIVGVPSMTLLGLSQRWFTASRTLRV
jgi:hypothetical protein